jgi:hypothetical protein
MTAPVEMIKKEHELAAISQAVKLAILSGLADGTGIAQAVSATVARELAGVIGVSVPSSARMTIVTASIASAAINGVLQSGCELAPATQGLLVPILRGTRLHGSEVLAAAMRASKIVTRAVAEGKCDLEAAVTGLIRGAIQSANEIGVDAADAATAAATGALNAVGDVRSSAYQTVLAAVTKPFDGIMISPKEPTVSSN